MTNCIWCGSTANKTLGSGNPYADLCGECSDTLRREVASEIETHVELFQIAKSFLHGSVKPMNDDSKKVNVSETITQALDMAQAFIIAKDAHNRATVEEAEGNARRLRQREISMFQA